MSEYLFPTGEILESSSPEFQTALGQVYDDPKQRVKCLCRNPSLPMYIAKRGELYIIKRMPNTGEQHAAACVSYEPPAALSGKAEVLGGAIKHDDESGLDVLRFDFSLTRGKRPGEAKATHQDADTVSADPKKLSLLGLLHYLWEQAGLVRWQPYQPVFRWLDIRDRLLQAADGALAKNHGLREILYVPEAFDRDSHDAQEARRIALWSRFDRAKSNGYLLCIGELKSFDKARIGRRLTIKHAPGVAFLLDDTTSERFGRRFRAMMDAWAADERTRLVAAMTCAVEGGIAHVQEITLMAVTHDWIPFDGRREHGLVAMLQGQEREFVKSLRYNLKPGAPMASAVLTDAGPQGVGLFLPPDEPEARAAWVGLIESYSGPTWEWSAGDMPPLPGRAAEAE